MKMSRCLFAVVAALLAGPAGAHVEAGQVQGFFSGLAHPVSGLDHVLAMVAVGLWGAQLGVPALWLLPLSFPIVMALGGLLGLLGIPLPGVEIGIAASALLLGGAVMSGRRVPLAAALGLVCLFAIFHGHAHGAEMAAEASALWYSLGFMLATAALHASGIGIALAAKQDWARRGLRIGGALIAASGVWLLAT